MAVRPHLPIGCALLCLCACGEAASPAASPSRGDAPPTATAPIVRAAVAELPPLRARVMDDADLLSPEAETRLSALSARLEQRTSDQMVVVTLPDLHEQPIEQVGLALGRSWHVGRRGKDNGVLLIVAPLEHKVRIEVGCGLEPILTNARAAAIIEQRMVPEYTLAHLEQGTEQGAEAIAEALTTAAATPRIGGCRR